MQAVTQASLPCCYTTTFASAGRKFQGVTSKSCAVGNIYIPLTVSSSLASNKQGPHLHDKVMHMLFV